MSAKIIDRDLGWRDLFKRVGEIKNSYVKVGVLDDAKGSALNGNLTVAEIAVVNEFGTEDQHIPSRPFVRSTFDEQREDLTALGKNLMGAVIDGKISTLRALNIMGAKLATEVKKKITTGAGVPPPNAPSTVAGKGSDRPLVDTGRLVNAITWQAIVGGKSDKG